MPLWYLMAGRADREDPRAGRAQVKPLHIASSAKDLLLAPGFHKGDLHAPTGGLRSST